VVRYRYICNFVIERDSSVVLSMDVNGTMLAMSSLDCKIRLFDLRTGLLKRAFSQVGQYWSVKFSPDGKQLISGSRVGDVHVFDVATGNMKVYGNGSSKTFESEREKEGQFALSVAYSPDGRFVASGHVGGTVCVRSTDSGNIVRTFQNHHMAVRGLSFSLDSKLLITGSDDNYVHVYDIEGNKLNQELTAHRDRIVSVSPHPSSSQIFATGSDDEQIKIWDLSKQGGACVLTVEAGVKKILDIQWSPFGDQIAVVGNSSSVEVYDIKL